MKKQDYEKIIAEFEKRVVELESRPSYKEPNRIVDSDSYKTSHWVQTPKGLTSQSFYLESRGSDRNYEAVMMFGLQYIVEKYFAKPITMAEVEEAREVITAHGMPFNYDGWKLLVERHGGKLPIRIRAVPEGTVVPLHTALMTVETTDPDFYWLGSYIETALMRVWYPITVATQSYYLRELILKSLIKTADNPEEEIKFKLHDFGSRGVSSQESAAIGGAAHLVNFLGTDTMVALTMLRDYYDAPMAGFSIPAGEHSTFSSWGKDHEVDAYRNMLKQYGREGSLLAVVSDTWNIYHACEKIWGEELRQEVIDSGATVVIRPDSGDPVTVLFGHSTKDLIEENGRYYVKGKYNSYKDQWGAEVWGDYDKEREVTPNEIKGIFDILAEKFGTTINSKGYKVLNNVRVIQGDGVNPESIAKILKVMEAKGYSTTNIAFGMGGALLQKVDRDTLKFAYKCSAATIDGKVVDVYKDPITDKGKTSKKGRLDTIQVHGYPAATVRLKDDEIAHPQTIMHTIYENGELMNHTTLDEVRARALTRQASSSTMSV
jgi:nicotinamide phosphoribosyltransferase